MAGINLFSYPQRFYPFFLLILGALFFFPFLGYIHLFDWDEINFAESSREMLVSGDYFHVQINYMPFWEKPPLFMWLQSASMGIFGVNEFAARFPNALFGLVTLYSLFHIGKKHFSSSFGLTWGLLYLMSFLPHVYFKSGIIDPVFNYFIFMSIYYLVCTINGGANKHAILGGVFAGLAILTKGPVGLLIVLLTYIVFVLVKRFKQTGSFKHMALFALSATAVTVIWVLPEIIQNGFATLGDFFKYQVRLLTTGDAGHEQPFFYHFVVVFIGCFPMSLFALPLFRARKFKTVFDFTTWMMILFWVVMILFTIVKTKIVHYSSMCWLPMSFCAAVLVHQKMNSVQPARVTRTVFLIGGLLFSVILMAVPVAGYMRYSIIPYVKDKFAVACMQQDVNWQLWYVSFGALFAACVVGGYLFIRRNNFGAFLSLQSMATGFTLFAYLLVVVPKIEQHSQRPAIDFYKSMAGKDVYVWPIGFKSYAHLYYFQVPPTLNAQRQDEQFLLYGAIDKPACFVTKSNNDFLDKKAAEGFKFIEQKGGFKFYVRNP